ncbi:hypothetical protein GC197_01300 [bacterium]|nr:hypothetical protein [bacterium]
MHWIGRSIFLFALLVIAGAIFWPSTWRTSANSEKPENNLAQETLPATADIGGNDADDINPEDDNPHVSDMQNNLTRALDGMLASHGEVFKDSEGGLREQIADADRRLTGIKSDIRTALRNANRQIRVPGQHSPLIMMVVIEGASRADVGFYEMDGRTPLLESLAEHGTVFQSCFAGPSAEIAQDMLLSGSGYRPGKPLGNLMTQMIWNSGYRTLLFDGSQWLSADQRRQYDDDVRATIDPTSGLPISLSLNSATAKLISNQNDDPADDISATKLLTGQARELLIKGATGRPTFAQFNFTITAKDEAQRLKQVAEIDQAIGRLFYTIGKERGGRSMMMIVVGMPSEHKGSGAILSQDNLTVPLMIYRSQGEPVLSVDQPCGLLDIMPTLANEIHSSRVPKHNGMSLLPLIEGNSKVAQRTFRWTNPQNPAEVAVCQGPWKAVFGQTNQLFYLPEDPHEQTDVSSEHPEVLKNLAKYGPASK